MLQLVLVCGFKRSGKDTLAKELQNQFGFHHMKISQPLKDATKILFNLTDEQLEEDKKDYVDPRWKMTPRDIMIYLGTDVFQYKINELLPQTKRRFWINNLLSEIEENYMSDVSSNKRIVISDLRFQHEHDALLEFQQKYNHNIDLNIIKIVRVGGIERLYHVDAHESEIDHLKFKYDYIIENKQDEKENFLKIIQKIGHQLNAKLT